MKQTALVKARIFEEEHGAQVLPQERPVFHVTPTIGWLNDPNGFSIYKGEYHLFYQYYPYDIHWGPTHWGHLKSKDFIKWERLPAALAPDSDYDIQGVFSGSAIELPDGRQLLMYTGVRGKDNTPECHQTQCIAIGDGTNYQKYEKNPVITADDIPEPCFAKDFRDPKIWWDEEEASFFAVAGIRVADESGAAALFSSKDRFSWNYVTILDYCRNEYGKMWECPDFFELGEKALLIVSPQEMLAEDLKFHNGNDVICLIGKYNKSEHQFTRERVEALDYGLDFYAPQTLKTPDGRRILIAWMQSWETSHLCPNSAKWNGMLTIARELTFVNGKLLQNPVRELLAYRKDPVIHQNIACKQQATALPKVSGRVLDMTVNIYPAEEHTLKRFTIRLAANEDYHTSITYDAQLGTVCFDRTHSGFRYNIITKREAPVRDQKGKISLRILMDRFSIEVFINNGEQVMSSTVYTPQEADGIFFEADGNGYFDVEKYELSL